MNISTDHLSLKNLAAPLVKVKYSVHCATLLETNRDTNESDDDSRSVSDRDT